MSILVTFYSIIIKSNQKKKKKKKKLFHWIKEFEFKVKLEKKKKKVILQFTLNSRNNCPSSNLILSPALKFLGYSALQVNVFVL